MSREFVLTAGLVLSGLGYSSLAWYVWRHRTAAGSRALICILLSVFIWSTFHALELTSRTVADAELWSIIKFVGVVGMPPALLAFAIAYTGRRGLRRRTIAVLAVLPTLTVISLILPPTRDLIHVYDPVERAARGPLPEAPIPVNGPLFWPHAIYNYSLALFALGLTVVRLSRAGPAYRPQAYLVTGSALVPLLANIAYNAGVFGPDATDPVPFLFPLLAIVLVWGFFRQELLDFLPVARDLVLEQMADGVIVLDLHDRVVDVNPAAAALLQLPSTEFIGRYLADLLPAAGPLLAESPAGAVRTADPTRGDLAVPAQAGVAVRDVSLSVTPLVLHGAPAGRVVLLHDVSERQTAQRRLRDLLEEQTRVAETLQTSLRPQTLPQVPGLQMAVRFMPSGAGGGQVSGDFYDVHRVLGGDWAIAIGDVSGKGVEAAVVTSMARYTVRTLSAEGRTPRQVLEHLNRALLVDEASERFCTLAYARLDGADLVRLGGIGGIGGLKDPGAARSQQGFSGPADVVESSRGADPEGQACVELTLVLGGHPRPLRRSRSGIVEAVGVPGTALGLLPIVDVQEVTVELMSGDVLLLYTDGVTEARWGTEMFGEERLAAVLAASAVGLRGRTGVTAAHLVAEAVAERVLTEVTDWASRRDDVAVMVLAVP